MTNFILQISIIMLIVSNSFPSLATVSKKAYSFQQIDTIKLIREKVLSKKANFQGQKLDVLLKKLNMDVKSYVLGSGWKPSSREPINIILYFDEHNTVLAKSQHDKVIPFLIVYFVDQVPKDKAQQMRLEGEGAWLQKEQNYYGNLVVKDIKGL